MPEDVDRVSADDRDDPAEGAAPRPDGPRSTWATRGVFGVGSASLFSDTGHEMVTSVLPTFITSTLHAGPAALGAIDGVADALTGLSKLAGGPLANDRTRRVRIASGGYLGTAVATAAIGLATAIWQVAILRALAWVSRGIRSPARDMMLTDLASEDAYGRAFGLERAGDNAGAIAGPLLASGLVAVLGLRHTILLAFIPGVLAAVAITIAGREARCTIASPAARRTLSFNLRALRRAGLGRALTPVALFEFGNLATTLLILRATDLLHTDTRSLTAATSLAVLLYAAHNAAATVASLGGGQIADRINPRVVFATGAGVYVASYLIFAVDQHAWPLVLLAFLLSGMGIGLAETAESTVVARGLPVQLRANGFGVLGLTQSLGDLVATVTVGVLWSLVSPTVAFSYAAAWMLASVAASGLLHPPEQAKT
ncbi:MAG: MFS transporter [Actinomycetota bacterium]|nr:MFS transporter [Actinomycetota bacterium]